MLNKKKTATITLKDRSGESIEIMLPANFEAILNQNEENAQISTFVEKFSEYNDWERERYQHFANSGRFPTESISDLMQIFDKMSTYFSASNVENYEDLGRLYASMEKIEYHGNLPEDEAYAELGKGVCDMEEGFFAGGNYYGKMKK